MSSLKRLTSNSDYQRVYESGKRIGNRHLAVRFLKREDSVLRIGVVAGKELGSAVRRNRAKRLLREVSRLNEARIKEGFDLILIARKEMRDFSYQDTKREFLELLTRAKLLRNER